VRTYTGKALTLLVKPTETVLDLRRKILIKEGIPISQQRLIFDGQLLENGFALATYNIQ
jgi:hypothetical protein